MRRTLMLCLGLVAVAVTGCQTVGSGMDRMFQPDLRADMADTDVDLAVTTMQTALESETNGTRVPWSNPQSGNSGSITPTRTYQTDSGLFCREFTESLNVDARTATYDETACRTDEGVWRLASS